MIDLRVSAAAKDCGTHFKPNLTRLMHALGLDVVYTRGLGSFLYFRDEDGEEVAVLDMAGGYGSLILGHAHPVLVAEAQRLLASGCPMHAQGSLHQWANDLAAELSARAGGDYCAVLANSGTEAVEVAIKHAMLETGARRFVALEGAFHGQTLGALQMTAAERYRVPFQMSGIEVTRVPLNDLARLEEAFASGHGLAAMIFEPVLGEGGIKPVGCEFALRAAELCAGRGIPLIADECQTGLGRTGTFLASESLGVRPNYIVLSKALGGGLAKIAAVLIERKRYLDEFDLMHTSTYADDDYSCAIALTTLRLVDRSVMSACSVKGARLLDGLRRLQRDFPDVIADVRGSAMMIGVEFRPLTDSASFVLRLISSQEMLGYVLAAYLLSVHRIRVAPTLGSAFTLRLEPSALVDPADLDRLVEAMQDVCGRLRDQDAVALTRAVGRGSLGPARMTGRSKQGGAVQVQGSRVIPSELDPPGIRVAWLFHLIDGDDLPRLEGQFAQLSRQDREKLLTGLAGLAAPVVMSRVDIRSATGLSARFYPVLLPCTSRWLKHQIDTHHLSFPQALVQQGVDLARSLGCRVVSLGQYTSIVTLNGTQVLNRGMSLTTGNSFSVAATSQALENAHLEMGSSPSDATLAVIGAGGNIGRACAEIIGPQYRRVVLIGTPKPGSRARLEQISRRLARSEIATDVCGVRDAHVVIVAVNSVDAPLEAADFSRHAIVCDVSVPASVHPLGMAGRPDVRWIRGGIVQLPFGEDLGISGFPLPTGQVYACLAEALLLGFEGTDTSFTGPVTHDRIQSVRHMAARHGFEPADSGVLRRDATGAA